MIAGLGIGLALSGLAPIDRRALLGVFVVAAPPTIRSGHTALIENMLQAIELPGRADPIRGRLAASRGLVLQAMRRNVALRQAWPNALIALLALEVPGAAGGRLICKQPQRGGSSCQATAPISPTLTGTPRIMPR
jgi:hypothetical protein